jgi:endonuclease I
LNIVKIIIICSFLFSETPIGYYNGTIGLSGESLKSALHNIIDNHNAQSYNSLHDHFESTDRKLNGTVWDMYSDVPNGNSAYVYHFVDSDHCGNYSGEGDCYNREHTWPQSWFNSASPMKSDLFQVYPTDGYVNSHRGSYPYGDVGSASWVSTNGSKKGNCSNAGYNGIVFEPIDEYKGDLARSYFYMSTRYYNEDSSWDNTDMTNGAEIKTWAVDMLLNWHQLDPVSEKEINRNEAVFAIQDNRNPFIDFPEWVECIWENQCEILGCTDSQAINYNPDANLDDDSCMFECIQGTLVGCIAEECQNGFSCVDDFEFNCQPSYCSCDEANGEWICTDDCNGGTCISNELRGDFNHDNQINIVDIVSIINQILDPNIITPYEEWASDLNEDTVLNVIDIVLVVNQILNI